MAAQAIRISILCCVCLFPVKGQNLVPNPSFEVFTMCPPSNLNDGPLECEPWLSLSGSSDYFHTCTDPMYRGVPTNFQGYQPAHIGLAYAGQYTWAFAAGHEFLTAPLLDNLEADHCYKVSAWINLANEGCGADQYGILLTPDPPTVFVGNFPQINWGGGILTDTVEWTNVLGYYTAIGNEQYITLGNFRGNSQTGVDPACYGPPAFSYYYVDDVLVEEIAVQQIDVDLGGPVTVCDSFIIDPGGDPDVVYNWSTGHQGHTLTVYTTGVYSVTASFACTQAVGDIEVTILNSIQVDLGPDLVLCTGDDVEISLDPDAGTYLWEDGSTDPDYTISSPGTYSVTLDDGCTMSMDEVVVTGMDIPPPFTLGPDTLLCGGDEFTIVLDPALGDFMWQDGSDETSYTIDNVGTYALTISNMCGEQSDEIEVITMAPPFITLGPDSAWLCDNEILDFEFDPDMGSYVWQDGSMFNYYTVSIEGLYSVTVTNVCGDDEDEIYVVHQNQPVIDLGSDLFGCPGDTFVLDPGIISGTYAWQDGSSGPTFTVTSNGTYALSVSNNCGSDLDMVNVTYAPPLVPPALGPDLTLCPGEQVLLSVTSPGASYLWNDLSTADTLLVSSGGLYFVEVSDACVAFTDTILITINDQPPVVQLPSDFDLCQGQSTVLDAGLTGVTYLWNDGSMGPQLNVTIPGIYSITVSNPCGSDVDSVVISAGEIPPSVFLGNDSSMCAGETILILPAFDNVDTWLWQDGSAGTQFLATSPGQYHVAVSNSCATAFDTLMIDLLPAVPPVSIGPDTSICPGESVVLSISLSNVDILWSDGSSNPDLIVSDSGAVYATVTNSCGAAADTVIISFLPTIPPLDLGQDQTICPGELVTFSPNIPDVTYVWHDGSTDPVFETSQEGTIILTISNSCGLASDTVVLIESTDGPQLDLGPDLNACVGDTIIIEAGISGVQYQWQDGSALNQYVTSTPGTFILNVSNACGTDADTILVDFTALPPTQDLGPDSTLCEGSTLVLNANASPGNTLTWQDQSSGTTYVVSSPGIYFVTAINQCGVLSDTVLIGYLDAPNPFYLGPDTILCAGESVTLSSPVTTYDAEWQDGSSSSDYLADQAGFYSLQLSNSCGAVSDTLEVSYNAEAPIVILEPSLLWCPGDQFTLDATQPFDATYQWNTGAMTSSIEVDTAGTYKVDVFTTCYQASGQTDILPNEDCPTGPVFYIPNVFSPDDNSINDVFTVFTDIPSDVISMEGTIFDRWGNLVYSSTENPFTWNGKLNDEPMNPGVYVYVIHIRYTGLAGEEEVVYSGDVTLVR